MVSVVLQTAVPRPKMVSQNNIPLQNSANGGGGEVGRKEGKKVGRLGGRREGKTDERNEE